MSKLEIRESRADDSGGIERLYRDAFPDEDLLPLVRQLLGRGKNVLSLVGTRDAVIAGHISFTYCHIEGGTEKVALLAPLAVASNSQKQGIGSALVRSGFVHLRDAKICDVFVLGDPAYYSRFGFKTEDKVTAPYPLPLEWREAWQSVCLCAAESPREGRLSVPGQWRRIELWAP